MKQKEIIAMTSKIRDVMTSNPLTLKRNAPMLEAARLMRDHGVGDVLVTENDGQLFGIVTDRDLVVRIVAAGEDPRDMPVERACSVDIARLSPDDDVDNAVKLMAKKAIRRIPIVEDGKPVGIVSLGDLAQALDQKSALGGISAAPPNV